MMLLTHRFSDVPHLSMVEGFLVMEVHCRQKPQRERRHMRERSHAMAIRRGHLFPDTAAACHLQLNNVQNGTDYHTITTIITTGLSPSLHRKICRKEHANTASRSLPHSLPPTILQNKAKCSVRRGADWSKMNSLLGMIGVRWSAVKPTWDVCPYKQLMASGHRNWTRTRNWKKFSDCSVSTSGGGSGWIGPLWSCVYKQNKEIYRNRCKSKEKCSPLTCKLRIT